MSLLHIHRWIIRRIGGVAKRGEEGAGGRRIYMFQAVLD